MYSYKKKKKQKERSKREERIILDKKEKNYKVWMKEKLYIYIRI